MGKRKYNVANEMRTMDIGGTLKLSKIDYSLKVITQAQSRLKTDGYKFKVHSLSGERYHTVLRLQ